MEVVACEKLSQRKRQTRWNEKSESAQMKEDKYEYSRNVPIFR